MLERPVYSRDYALHIAYDKFFDPFKANFSQIKCVIVGSIRREKEFVHDIDILVVSTLPEVKEWCGNKLNNKDLLYLRGELPGLFGPIKTQVWLCNESEYGPSLLKWTGPHHFNVKLSSIAKHYGAMLSEHGLFLGTPENKIKRIDENTESNIIWLLLNRKWIHPRDRY